MNLKEIRERVEEIYKQAEYPRSGIEFVTFLSGDGESQLLTHKADLVQISKDLLKALGDARPMISRLSGDVCFACEQRPGYKECRHGKARAWLKKYPEEG